MFKPRKLCAELYEVETEKGVFEVNGSIQGYGDYGWNVIYPDGYISEPFPTKKEAYNVIKSFLND